VSDNASLQPEDHAPLVRAAAAFDPAAAFGKIVAALALALFLSLTLAFAGAFVAHADVPDPRNCVADSNLVASPGGGFAYTVLLRDAANQPLPGATVVLDFTTAPGIVLCADQDVDHDGRIFATTNAIGSATFYVKAGGNSSGRVTVGTALDVVVRARPRTTDFDGDLDVDGADRTALAGMVGTSGPAGDFDKNGIVNAADQALFEQRFGNNCTLTPTLPETWGRVKDLYR